MKRWTLACIFLLLSCSLKIEGDGAKVDEGRVAAVNKKPVVPSKCEGKVSPLCVENALFQYVKVYPKYDRDTCQILDNPYTGVDISLCIIDENLAKIVKPFLPSPIELLGVVSAKPYDTLYYRVAYRAGDLMEDKVFDASGKELPINTSFIKYGWVGDRLRNELAKTPLESKVRSFSIYLKSHPGLSNQASEDARRKDLGEIRKIMAPVLPEIDALVEAAIDDRWNPIRFEMDVLVLQPKIDALAPFVEVIDFTAVACPQGYPNFCVNKAGGGYEWGDPIRIDVEDACPLYEAPPGAVDNSFCANL